ncbi:hypothetical protein GCM10012285_26580 [Streptomyces kronopolitis]|uniref:Uncharacterized protein n=1 Tax=Streptomyces kronopolitis TaxID=1612435 RepID=A0ABQ2JCF8_9ACTN|nr:hypothetical protein GCM10012285_26580 [Streptomyces kronopolitis]
MARAFRPHAPRPVGHKQAAAASPGACRPARPGIEHAGARQGGRRGMTPPGARPRRPGTATPTETVPHWL